MRFKLKYLILLFAMFTVVRAADDKAMDDEDITVRVIGKNVMDAKCVSSHPLNDEDRDSQKRMVSKFYKAIARDVLSKLSTGLFYLGTALIAGSAFDYACINADLLAGVFSVGVGMMANSLIMTNYLISLSYIPEYAKLVIPAGVSCFALKYLIDTKILVNQMLNQDNEKEE